MTTYAPRTARPASPKQVAFIQRLAAERVIDQYDDLSDLVARAADLDAHWASRTIDMLMAAPKRPTMHEDGAAVTEGYYLQEDTVYRVVAAKSTGNLYAKKLVTSEFGRAAWGYAPGAMRHLAHAARLTIQDAADMGTRYGVCVVCGRTLTASESVEAGIGPICSGRL